MKGKALLIVVFGIAAALLRWKRAALASLITGQRPGVALRDTQPPAPTLRAASAPVTEASRPSDSGDAPRTTLAAQNFPTGAAATEEVAVDAEDDIPDSPRADDASDSSDTSTATNGGEEAVAGDVADHAGGNALERLAGKESDPGNWVRGDGSTACPDEYPIKGNGTSHIYHMPGESSYAATIAELCFSTEDAAAAEGFRPTKRNRHE